MTPDDRRDGAFAPDDSAPAAPPAHDPIVEEVRAAREALFAQAGYDLEEFGRQIRASEAAEGLTSVVWPPRAP